MLFFSLLKLLQHLKLQKHTNLSAHNLFFQAFSASIIAKNAKSIRRQFVIQASKSTEKRESICLRITFA